MKQYKYKVGENYNIIEKLGIYRKTITNILWREKNKGDVYIGKDEVLEDALEWCIILFDTGEWMNGNEFKSSVLN